MTPDQAYIEYVKYSKIKDNLIAELIAGINCRYDHIIKKYWKIYADSL